MLNLSRIQRGVTLLSLRRLVRWRGSRWLISLARASPLLERLHDGPPPAAELLLHPPPRFSVGLHARCMHLKWSRETALLRDAGILYEYITGTVEIVETVRAVGKSSNETYIFKLRCPETERRTLIQRTPRHQASAMEIPHLLHQSWRDANVPQGLQEAIRSWRRVQPEWRYQFHSDADNLNLVRQRYPWLMPVFMRSTGIQRADISRYMYMHAFGGVYADLDVELLKPLSPMLAQLPQLFGPNTSVLLGQEPLAHAVLLERKARQVCNAVLASVPGHPFWLDVLHRINRAGRAGLEPVGTTGPRMLEKVVDTWHARHGGGPSGGGVMVVEPDVFYPTWDPMQHATFRQRCAQVVRRRAKTWGWGAVPTDSLADLRLRACERLRRESFRPTIVPAAFTNHLWTHTWINGASKVSLVQLYRLENARRSRRLRQLPRAWQVGLPACGRVNASSPDAPCL